MNATATAKAIKLVFNLKAARRLERKTKVGYEFTITNENFDPDDYEYDNLLKQDYDFRMERCKDAIKSDLMRDYAHYLTTYDNSQSKDVQAMVKYFAADPYYVVHNDPGVIEISAPPTTSIRRNQQMLNIVLNNAAENGFVPYRGECCGGMHANVDIPLPRQRRHFSETKRGIALYTRYDFLRNMCYHHIDRWERIIDCCEYGSERRNAIRLRYNAAMERSYNKRKALERKMSKLDATYSKKHPLTNLRASAARVVTAINKILNMFPSIAWIFHAPNDDDSAEIRHRFNSNIDSKYGAARLDGSYKFVEFRCIGMIGTSQQLPYVDKFFRRLVALAVQNADILNNVNYQQEPNDFREYTVKKTVHEFHHVCRLLHLDAADYRWWFENHLIPRFNDYHMHDEYTSFKK